MVGIEQHIRNALSRWGKVGVAALITGLWLSTSFYSVAPQEEGLVRRFGAYVRSEAPGFHRKWPWPVETVDTVAVTEVKRLEVGFRTVHSGPPTRYMDVPEESKILTGDENILSTDLTVHYRVKKPEDYLFNNRNIETVLQKAAEAVLHQELGDRGVEAALTTDKQEIEQAIRAKLQDLADFYKAGVTVLSAQLQDVAPPDAVKEAFQDVASAKDDMRRFTNKARGYYHEKVPEAEGKASAMIRAAEAYRKERIEKAKGDIERFSQIQEEYAKAPAITKARLYLEAMEDALSKYGKIIVIDKDSGHLKTLNLGSPGIFNIENKVTPPSVQSPGDQE